MKTESLTFIFILASLLGLIYVKLIGLEPSVWSQTSAATPSHTNKLMHIINVSLPQMLTTPLPKHFLVQLGKFNRSLLRNECRIHRGVDLGRASPKCVSDWLMCVYVIYNSIYLSNLMDKKTIHFDNECNFYQHLCFTDICKNSLPPDISCSASIPKRSVLFGDEFLVYCDIVPKVMFKIDFQRVCFISKTDNVKRWKCKFSL